MWNIAEIFKSPQREEEAEGEEAVACLARRYRGLTVSACAHAVFFCSLLHALRPSRTEKAFPASLVDNCGLEIGIIGGGHLGKQLAQVLLTRSCRAAAPLCCSIRISTRRPESLELQEQGVACFYDNARLVAWADVVFLCCLPSHVLTVCSAARPALRKPCLVYSLVSAVPLRRLKRLLSYSAIVRPQYRCSDREPTAEWRTKGPVRAALQDPAVVQATCPCTSQGKIRVNTKWLVASFYAALNSSMWQRLPHQRALKLLNDLCFPEHCPICAEEKTSCPRFVRESFVSETFASSMTPEDPFPWFDLAAAQLSESPFGQLLAGSEAVRSHLAALYRGAVGGRPAAPPPPPPAPVAEHGASSAAASSHISPNRLEEATESDSKSSQSATGLTTGSFAEILP